MLRILITAVIFTISLSNLSAQQTDTDFANKIKPEYRLDLTQKPAETPSATRKKTAAELQEELKALKIQQKNIDQEISRMEASGTPKEDNMYVKLQFARKYVNGQIAGREKVLQHSENK